MNKTEIDKAFDSFPFLMFSTRLGGWEFLSESFRNYARKSSPGMWNLLLGIL